jgi:predicted  nucleic acid-binding Zn-ribbon protein
MSNETVTYSLEAVLTRIEGKIDSYQKDVSQKFDKIEERLTRLEIGQSELKGDIKALDSKVIETEKRINDLNGRLNVTSNAFLGIVGILVTGILGILGKIVFFPNP